MSKRIAAILTALVLGFTAVAAAAETLPAAVAAKLTLGDIEALNGGPVPVHRENGRITFIGGTCSAEPVKSPEDAKKVIGSVLPLLGGDERTQLDPRRVLNDPAGNVYYVFQQVREDLLVQGGAVKVITDRDGNMTGLTASLVSEPAEAGTDGDLPDISAEEAESRVLAHEREAGSGEPDILEGRTARIILPVDRVPDLEADELLSRYVWVVYSANPSAGASRSALPYLAHYVTLDGEYLYSLPTLVPGDTAGTAGYDAGYVFQFMEPVDYTGFVDYSDGTEHEISVTLMRDTRTGMYYLGNIEHKIVVADCWEFLYNGGHVVLEYSPDNLEWDQTSLMSLYNYCRAWDYFSAVGWKGGDGKETPIIILKDFCDRDHHPVDNAAYAGRFYGWDTFLSSSVNDLAQCLDVSAHEFTHCVTENLMTYNAYMNDCGAINEAVSDIHGNLCEMLAEATEDTSWLLGENTGETIRSMSDPHRYQQPEYVWDVYYRAGVQEPTDTNDYGGVHDNSSLLNRVAYLLCADGGMSLEEARAYWFAADCAMVPGSDYPQLRVLLPWVMKNTGLDRYRDALAKALDATRLGEAGLPDSVDADKALLVLNLPDNEVFSNGKWILQFASVNFEKMTAFITTLMEDIESGNLEGYPQVVRDLCASGENPGPGQEESPGFWETLFGVFTDILSSPEEPENPPEAEEPDPEAEELFSWIQDSLKDCLHYDMGSAGQDGHSIRVMGLPGRTFPLLLYLSVDPGGAMIEQAKAVVFVNGRWFDLTGLLAGATGEDGNPDLEKLLENLLGSDLLAELFTALVSSRSISDFLNTLSLDVKGGQVCQLPADGLEQIDLVTGIFNQSIGPESEPNNRKSRPKLP